MFLLYSMLMWFSIRLVMLFVVANNSVLIAVDYVIRFPRWFIRYLVNYDYFLLLVLVSSIYALLSQNLSYNINFLYHCWDYTSNISPHTIPGSSNLGSRVKPSGSVKELMFSICATAASRRRLYHLCRIDNLFKTLLHNLLRIRDDFFFASNSAKSILCFGFPQRDHSCHLLY